MNKYAKAIVAGLSVALTAAIPLTDNGLTLKECLIVLAAGLAGTFPTWAVPNDATDKGEEGCANVPFIVWCLAGLVLLVVLAELVGHPVHVG